ncbi:MAG: formyl-CoA transferase [Myxococcota bacterium]|jgi:formyl-CoA transferase
MEKSEFFKDARNDITGPLAGVRVLEATTTWAGPMCGCMLADFGADVIKVEHPLGEVARRSPPFLPGTEPPLSFMHHTVNRNKRSLSLDLHDQRGREIFLQLAERADVVVENFRPGTLSGWGLGYEDVRRRRPDTVYVSISGYGQFGPESGRVGYDPLAQAESGFISLNGSPDDEGVKTPTFLGDDLAGLHGALGALAALRHRDATGEGQHIDVALLDGLLFQSAGYLTLGAMGVDLPRLGNEFRVAAPARTYACRDGNVMAGVLLDTHWKTLARVIGKPELADDPRYSVAKERIDRRSEVDRIVADWMRERSLAEVLREFGDAGIPAGAVCTYAEAANAPNTAARDMLQRVPDPASGTHSPPITGPAAKFSRTPTRVRSSAPTLGQHNDEILAELGLSDEELGSLREDGVV